MKTSRGRRAFLLSTIQLDGQDGRLFLHVLAAPGSERAAVEAPRLTPRQQEVLELLAEGVPAKSVAARLGIRETTIRNHIRAVLAELGAHSQLEAVAKARRLGLVT